MKIPSFPLKRAFVLFLNVALLPFAFSCQHKETPPRLATKGVQLTSEVSGDVHTWTAIHSPFVTSSRESEPLTYTFRIINDAPNPLAVKSSSRTCGCVDYRIANEFVAPNEYLEVTLSTSAGSAKHASSGCQINAEVAGENRQIVLMQRVDAYSPISFENEQSHTVLTEFSAGKNEAKRIIYQHADNASERLPLTVKHFTIDGISLILNRQDERLLPKTNILRTIYELDIQKNSSLIEHGSGTAVMHLGTEEYQLSLA